MLFRSTKGAGPLPQGRHVVPLQEHRKEKKNLERAFHLFYFFGCRSENQEGSTRMAKIIRKKAKQGKMKERNQWLVVLAKKFFGGKIADHTYYLGRDKARERECNMEVRNRKLTANICFNTHLEKVKDKGGAFR